MNEWMDGWMDGAGLIATASEAQWTECVLNWKRNQRDDLARHATSFTVALRVIVCCWLATSYRCNVVLNRLRTIA